MRFLSIKVFEAAAKLFPPSCVPANSTKNCKRTIFPFSCFQPMHRHSLLKTCSLIHESHRSRWARDQSRSSSSAAQPLTARIVLPPASLPLLSAPHVNELIWAWSLQQHRILQSATHCAQQLCLSISVPPPLDPHSPACTSSPRWLLGVALARLPPAELEQA